MRKTLPPLAVLALVLALPAPAQDLAAFEKKVTVKTLANGLTVLVCERPEAPVFSFFTHVDVGGDREVPGITGLAHMFEHMAFKGTDRIGTTDYAEREARARGGRGGLRRLRRERRKSVGARRQEGRRAREGLEGRDRRGRPLRGAERVRRDRRPRGRRGPERLHQLRRDRLLLLLPGQPARAVGLPRVGALPEARDARVLQGARRRPRGAADAHREPADRPAARAVPGRGLHGPPLRAARGGLALRPQDVLRHRRARLLTPATTSRRT